MNALVHIIMHTCLYPEIEIPFAHAGGNEVLKHGQAEHEDENQEPQEQEPTTYRPGQCKKYWVTLPKTWSAGPLVQNWTAVPCVGALGQIWAGCFRSPLETTGPELVPLNKHPNPKEEKSKRASQRRQLDWSWSQQNREKPKGQLGGDCMSGLGPNRNGGKPKGSSAETARPVLVTQPTGKTINP